VRGFGIDPHEHLAGEVVVRQQAPRTGQADREEAENLSGDALVVAVEFTGKPTNWQPKPTRKYEQYQEVRWWNPSKGNARKFLRWAYQGDDSATGPLPSQSFISSLYGRLLCQRQEVEAGDLAFYICKSKSCVGKREEEIRANQELAQARKQEEEAEKRFGKDSVEVRNARANVNEAVKKANKASEAAAKTQREFDGRVNEANPICPSCGGPSFWICMKGLLYVPGVYGGRWFRGCNAGRKRVAGKKHETGKDWPHYFSMRMNPHDKNRIEQGQGVPKPDCVAPLPPDCCPQHKRKDYCSQSTTKLMVQIHHARALQIPQVERESDNENE